MLSRRTILVLLATVVCVATFAGTSAANPGPQPVDGFGDLDGGEYEPYAYPPSNTTNVTVDVVVLSNGTSEWTERATLTNVETAEPFRTNDSLRRAVVRDRFATRFDEPTEALRSHVQARALVVTYRLDESVHRGPRGGLAFTAFASYRGWYVPGSADVTIRSPPGYTPVDASAVFARHGRSLRWNQTTASAAGPTVDSPELVTFAPADEPLPGVRASLALARVYAAPTLGVGAGYAFLFGGPLALLVGGLAALARRERRTVGAIVVGTVLAVFVATTVTFYPATTPDTAFHPFFLFFTLPAAGTIALVGVVLFAVAYFRDRWPDQG